MPIIDANTEDLTHMAETDICIIGGGAAGITLALQFINTSHRVCILESGGNEYEQNTQDLYQGDNVWLNYDLEASRLHFLGGATNHWNGWCAPLDKSDFEKKEARLLPRADLV